MTCSPKTGSLRLILKFQRQTGTSFGFSHKTFYGTTAQSTVRTASLALHLRGSKCYNRRCDLSKSRYTQKGFIGSQDTNRPSLKIKLDHYIKGEAIDGLDNLTFNNNKQDVTLMNQFLCYDLFDRAGAPGSRCGYARITVNGKNLGVYSHVESVRKQLLKREFEALKAPSTKVQWLISMRIGKVALTGKPEKEKGPRGNQQSHRRDEGSRRHAGCQR